MQFQKAEAYIGTYVHVISLAKNHIRSFKCFRNTYTTICSTPIPIILPMIAPTAMLGMNNPHGIYNIKCIKNTTSQCTVSRRIIRINEYSISNHVGLHVHVCVFTFMPKVKTVMIPLNTRARASIHKALQTPSPMTVLEVIVFREV